MIPDFEGKNTDFKILWDPKNNHIFLYTDNEKSKMRLRNKFINNSIKKNKILWNKFNQRNKRLVHRKLRNINERN